MKLLRITEEIFPDYWPQIEPLLRANCTLSSGRFSVEGWLEGLAKGECDFWVIINEQTKVYAFGISEMNTYKTGLKVLNIPIITGKEVHSWKHMIDELAQWAKDNGCSMIETWAPKGWGRLVPSFTSTHVRFEGAL